MTRRLLVVAAAVATLLLPAATPAAAEEPPVFYYAAPCATGAFTGYTGSLDAKYGPLVEVSGWIRPCLLNSLTSKFGFVHYFQQTALLAIDDSIGTGLKAYTTRTGTTYFTIASQLTSDAHTQLENELGQLTAICLIRDRYTRLACVAVDRPKPELLPVVTPLPVDDERVQSIPVTSQLESGDISPIVQHCGNCI